MSAGRKSVSPGTSSPLGITSRGSLMHEVCSRAHEWLRRWCRKRATRQCPSTPELHAAHRWGQWVMQVRLTSSFRDLGQLSLANRVRVAAPCSRPSAVASFALRKRPTTLRLTWALRLDCGDCGFARYVFSLIATFAPREVPGQSSHCFTSIASSLAQHVLLFR